MDQLVQNEQHQDNQNQINLNLNEQEQIQQVQDAPNQIEEKPQQIQITRGSDTFNLPAVLAAQKDATEFLGAKFAKDNASYIKKADYKADSALIKNYYDRTRMEVKLSYKDRTKKENALVNAEIYKLATDKKFGLNGDNKGMREIKTKLTILQNVLAGDIQQYKKEVKRMEPAAEGGMKEVTRSVVDAAKFGETISAAFDTTIEACMNYINSHANPKSWWGKRRKRRAIRMKEYLMREQFKYKASVKSLESGAYEGKLFSTLKTPQDLVEKLDVITIENAVLQRQGNSMDTYVVQVEELDEKGNPTMKTYYMKENLPLINQNVTSFLERRTEQLKVSKDHKHKGNLMKEELRLQTAAIDDTDYDNGISLLEIMQRKIKEAGLANQEAVKERYVEFFRHDFDSLFKDLRRYNDEVDRLNKLITAGQKIELGDWEEKAKLDPLAGVILEALKNRQNVDIHETITKETPLSWIIKKLNLDETKDSDTEIVELLRKMENEQPVNAGAQNEEGEQKDSLSRIETMFRITMGKEVELFGQIMEGDQAGENEMSQYNTMVTSYLAQRYGFKEVVNTHMRNANFTRGNDTVASGAPVTLQEEAPGDEWIEIIKDTRDNKPGKMIKQTGNSVRELIRLQMYDGFCLQKDRHGRNFKCKHEPQGDAEFIKAEDAIRHDQSFYASLMKDAFKEKRDEKGKLTECSKNRFLPSSFKVVKKGSAMYKYIAKKYFNSEIKNPDWAKNIEEPLFEKVNEKTGVKEKFRLNNWMKDHLFLSMLGAKKGKNGEKILPDSADFDAYIKLLEKGEDVSLHDRDHPKYIVRRDRPDEKIVAGTKTYLNVLKQLNEIVRDIADFYLLDEPDEAYAESKVAERSKNPNANYKDKEKWLSDQYINRSPDLKKLPKVASRMAELKQLSDTYDLEKLFVFFPGGFTMNLSESCEKVLPNGEIEEVKRFEGFTFDYDGWTQTTGGVVEGWIKQMLYTFTKSYGNNPNIQNELSSVGKPKEFEKLENENGDIVVPGLLHADLEAKQELENIVHDFEHGNIKEMMLQEQMTLDAVTASYERAKEQLQRLEEMRVSAEVFLNTMYADLPKDDPHRKFYLTKEEFDLFDDLSEFAVDPGDSYLVQDNEHFLACQEEYSQYMSEEEKQSVLAERNAVLSDSKRWKDKPVDHLSTNISSSIHKKDGQAKKDWQHFAKVQVRAEDDVLPPEEQKKRSDKLHAMQLEKLNKDLIPLKKQSEEFAKTRLEYVKTLRDRNEAIKKAKFKRWDDKVSQEVDKWNAKAREIENKCKIRVSDLYLDKHHPYAWMEEYKTYADKVDDQYEKTNELERNYNKELDDEQERVVGEYLKPVFEEAEAFYKSEIKPLLEKWGEIYPKYKASNEEKNKLQKAIDALEQAPDYKKDAPSEELVGLRKQLEEKENENKKLQAMHFGLYEEMKRQLDFDYQKNTPNWSTITAKLRHRFLPEDATFRETSRFEEKFKDESKWAYDILMKSYTRKKRVVRYGGY